MMISTSVGYSKRFTSIILNLFFGFFGGVVGDSLI